MLNQKVNECVHACNRCAAVCIQRASACFVFGDPACVTQRLLLDQENINAWRLCADAFRFINRRI